MTDAAPDLYIFDLDGTLRWTARPGARYPLVDDEWHLMPGVAARLSAIPWSTRGPWLATASNQCGVGEGLIRAEDARRLIVDCLAAAIGRLPPGAAIDFCTCPEDSPCPRQKPAPGLLLAALACFAVPAHRALFVGDLDIDRQAAAAAGVPFMWATTFFAHHGRGGGAATGCSP